MADLQTPVLTAGIGQLDLRDIAVYRAQGGYEQLRRAVLELSPKDVADLCAGSSLRGRGGAGFPTARKWSFLPNNGRPRYMVCNCDEAEPGTFKDHMLLEETPHQIIEGILIGAYAIGCDHAFIYIRGEFKRGYEIMREALEEARRAGFVGDDVFGSGKRLRFTIHRGAGAYICGEETGLLNSLEGRRGEPRLKPPFPAVKGLYGEPTVVNNVETLAYLPSIMRYGPEWFAKVGPERSPGYKIVSISGHVVKPGNYEVAMGTTIRQLIWDCAGGLRPGRSFRGVQPGGGSSACLFEEHLDVPYDFDSVTKAGSMLGSGAMVVFDDTTDFVRAAYTLIRFYSHESCGQCTPCREGGHWIQRTLERLLDGGGLDSDIDVIASAAHQLTGLNLCALGDSIEPFLGSVITRYEDQFRAYIPRPAAVRLVTSVAATDMVTVTIDGIAVRVAKNSLLVEAAKTIHRDIPVYCYHEKLGPAGLCRICLVEIDGMPKLQIACNTPVTDGMVVHTTNPRVDDGRRAILEFFLLNHPLDCPICDKGGECDLQDYAMAYGQGASRMVEAKMPKPKAVDLGPTIVLDEERCIVCQRCVRFDDVITRERSLRTDDRSAHTIIATATGKPYVSDFTGNVTELCPVGALTSKTYRFRSRPWDNHRTTTSCTQCAVGCRMHVDERANVVLRTMSVAEDDDVSDSWLCDRGRYNVGFIADDRRITQPLLKRDGEWTQIDWPDAIALWAEKLTAAGARAGVIGGGRLLNEEVYLAAHVFRAIGIENLDHRVGAQTVVHHDGFAGFVDLEQADTIVTLGRPPSQLAPVLDLRIRKAVTRHGARLISVGDHAANSFVPEIRATSADELRAALTGNLGRVAQIWDGVMIADGPALTAPMHELPSATRVDRYVLPEEPNGRGADALGLRPVGGALTTRAMFEAARDGRLDVLTLLGANPMLRFPDRALAEAALQAAPFVVITELFMTASAELADLILPVCSAFEKTGTTTNLAGEILAVSAAVRAPNEVIADGDAIVLLAEALGIRLPDVADMEGGIRELVRTPPTFAPDAAPAAPSAVPADGSLRVIRETAIFTGGGTLAFDERIAELRTVPRATLHPDTARALGLVPGDRVSAGAPHGPALRDLLIAIDPRVPAGAVALVDGIAAAPLNIFGAADVVRLEKALVPA